MKITSRAEDYDSENELNVYWEINHENIVKYFDHFNARLHFNIDYTESYTFLIIEHCEVSKKIILLTIKLV
jgi:hypothetical protein